MKFILLNVVVTGFCLMLSMTAKASLITGLGDIFTDPDLITGTVMDFESTPDGPFSSLVEGNLTLTAFGPAYSQDIYAGVFNTQGRYVTNGFGGGDGFEFRFASSVDFLAFNIGASDEIWMLTAYRNGVELDSLAIQPVRGSMNGEYIGVKALGMTHAIFTRTFGGSANGDDIFIDNVIYGTTKVSESSTIAIFTLGMMALVSRRFKKQS